MVFETISPPYAAARCVLYALGGLYVLLSSPRHLGAAFGGFLAICTMAMVSCWGHDYIAFLMYCVLVAVAYKSNVITDAVLGSMIYGLAYCCGVVIAPRVDPGGFPPANFWGESVPPFFGGRLPPLIALALGMPALNLLAHWTRKADGLLRGFKDMN
ncbi:MAG TPA: hypothetical protein VKX17_16125 [Planctomycetota bacterium]|nr:hypothetical protein [Planctomycetota bacterium]